MKNHISNAVIDTSVGTCNTHFETRKNVLVGDHNVRDSEDQISNLVQQYDFECQSPSLLENENINNAHLQTIQETNIPVNNPPLLQSLTTQVLKLHNKLTLYRTT